MLRRVFCVLSVLSLVACVAVVALWVRSYSYVSYADSYVYWNTPGRGERRAYWAISYSGGLCYARLRDGTDDPEAARLFARSRSGSRFDVRATGKWKSASSGFVRKTFAGFGFNLDERRGEDDLKLRGLAWAVAVPYGFVAALFALPP